jgi:hypothetical protein
MIERHCDVHGCGRVITGPELARQPRRIALPGVKLGVTVSFTFNGKRPHVCDQCLIGAVKALEGGNVIQLSERMGTR